MHQKPETYGDYAIAIKFFDKIWKSTLKRELKYEEDKTYPIVIDGEFDVCGRGSFAERIVRAKYINFK